VFKISLYLGKTKIRGVDIGYGGGGIPLKICEYSKAGPTGDIVSVTPTNIFASATASFWNDRPHRSYTNHQVGNLSQKPCLNMTGCPNLVFICMPNFQTAWVQRQF